MNVRILTASDASKYDEWLSSCCDATLWQSSSWKQYQQALKREVRQYVCEVKSQIVASAQIVIDRTSFGLCVWDCPRGPVVGLIHDYRKDKAVGKLLERICADAKHDKCLSLYISPMSALTISGLPLTPSSRHEQPQATVCLDLRQSDDELLAQMHPKARYNSKLAAKHGVQIEESRDIDAYYTLAKQTAARDGFTIKPKREYQAFLNHLPGSFLLMATHDKKPVAGLLGVIWNGTGIYYYGASDHAHRALMAPYVLQWESMKMCKAKNCHTYDLLGIASSQAAKDDAWQGITEFKKKFGGSVSEYPPEQEIVLKPIAKKMLGLKRRFL